MQINWESFVIATDKEFTCRKKSLLKDTLKTFDDFKYKQQKCMICKI